MYFITQPFLQNFRLDIVGFLAILGEASVLETAQNTYLSLAGFLPRLVPAPQALIRTQRPTRLATAAGLVVGCKSGSAINGIGHLAHILHRADEIPRYHIKNIAISRRGHDASSRPWDNDCYAEAGAETAHTQPPRAKIARYGPLTWLAVSGCALFAALLFLSIHLDDGMALIGTLLLGCLSALLQAGSYSRVELAPYRTKRKLMPASHLVVKYPNGSFLYVECEEEVARKLYIEPETIKHFLNEGSFRLVGLLGVFMLMGSVICLANATIQLQLAYVGAYVVLNAGHWLVAALPPRLHWDLSDFEVKIARKCASENYAQALWTMIAMTRTVEWITISDVAPSNNPWKNWVAQASQQLTEPTRFDNQGRLVSPRWDCQAALTQHLNNAYSDAIPSQTEHGINAVQSEAGVEEEKEREVNASTLETMVLAGPAIQYGVARASTC